MTAPRGRGLPKQATVPAKPVCGLIVTHHPDAGRVRKVVTAILPQVDRLLLVDDGSDRRELAVLNELIGEAQAELIELGANLGLAAALNHGIDAARSRGFEFVLLLDQDSIPGPGMVSKLYAGLHSMLESGQRVAVVGPEVVDPRIAGRNPFITFGTVGLRRHSCESGGDQDPIVTDFVISSGMLLPVAVFDEIGSFDEELFIDNVDLDWCFRALKHGYRCYGICDAELFHHLGDDVYRIWLGRWLPVYRHGPLRQYYIMRNRVLLYRRDYSPSGWVIQDIARALFKFLVFSVVFPDRLANIRMMLRGLRDGMNGVTGAYNS